MALMRLDPMKVAWLFSVVLGAAFSTSDEDFSEAEARIFASLSQAAYCGSHHPQAEQLLSWSCVPCGDSGVEAVPGSVRIAWHSEVGNNNATFAYVARLAAPDRFADKCLVSIRGSATIANWAGNFEFWKEPVPLEDCSGCAAEKGFYSIWRGLKPTILTNLDDVGCGPESGRSIIFTGHSMGGAVAVLAMYSLYTRGYKIEPGMTFEAPRVGNAAFVDAFASVFQSNLTRRLWRVTRYMDPVPLLPPRALGYEHVDEEIYYDEHANYHVCNGGEDPKCINANSLPISILHAADHCESPLVPSGRICGCQVAPTAVPAGILVV